MTKESLIYIITNPAYPENCVKIGFTTDLKNRLRTFNTSAIDDFEVFTTYDVPNIENHKPDQMLHKLLTKLDPTLKVKQNKEFYYLYPEEAYEILQYIAIMHDRTDCLHLYGELKGRKSENKQPKANVVKGNKYFVKGATMVSTGEGRYILLKGSILREWNGNTIYIKFKEQRDEFIASGAISNINDELVTQTDLTFNSPSAAAAFVYCAHRNGWTTWKDKDGNTIDEIERKK